jgi:glycosyltransferase involved in cell wall biosynthesis
VAPKPRRACLVGLIGGGHSGVPRYAVALTKAIDRVAGEYPALALALLTTAAGADAIDARSIAVDVVAGRSRRANAGPGRIVLEQALVRRRDDDVLHYFDVTGPLLAPRRRFVATVHDTAFVHGYAPRTSAYKRLLYPWTLRHATALVAVSQFAKDEAVTHFGADEAKIAVVHSGPGLSTPLDGRSSDDSGPPFLLYVGNLGGNKNLPFLVRSYDRAPTDARLVLAGRARGDVDELRRTIDGAANRHRIELAGDVADDELERLYGSARALLLPSVYEGFGFTALEAMARGCPVVASDIPALREVAGSGALLLPLGDEEAWASAMATVAADEATRADLRARGAETVARYSWERTARGVLDVLSRAAA